MGGSLSWVSRTARPDMQRVGDRVGLLVPIGGYSRRTDRYLHGGRMTLPPDIFRRKPNKSGYVLAQSPNRFKPTKRTVDYLRYFREPLLD